MGVAGLLAVVGAVLTIAGGLGLAVAGQDVPQRMALALGLTRSTRELNLTATGLAARTGRIPAAVVAFALGIGSVVLICWPFGELAKRSLAFDKRMYTWSQTHAVHQLTSVMNVLTKMGNRPYIKPVTLIAVVVIAILYKKRFWVPVVIFATGFVTEFYLQNLLSRAVARSLPLPSHGSFPSGGCARLVLTYGMIWWLLTRRYDAISTRWKIVGWTVVSTAAFLEAFSRIYLLKHWATDALGGLVFGAVLLVAMIGTAALLDRDGALFVRRAHKLPSTPEPVPAGT